MNDEWMNDEELETEIPSVIVSPDEDEDYDENGRKHKRYVPHINVDFNDYPESQAINSSSNSNSNSDNVISLTAKRREQHRRTQSTIKTGARLEKMLREAREHPLGLYRLCFKDDFGEAVTLKWFHKEWSDMILTSSHVMIEAPRGSTKTTFIICCILWIFGHNPELRIKLICGNDVNAAKRLDEIRSHINNDQLYQLVFPNVKEDPQRTNNTLVLNLKRARHTKDATLEAKGVLSDGTGDRTDVLVLDDVCTRKNSVDEPATRPKVLGKLRSDWLNTLDPRQGKVWSIFTPWHAEDANSILKKETKGRWAYKRYAHGKPGNPHFSIFPELFSETYLRKKRLDIGTIEYSAAYLCKTVSGDVQLVRSNWLRPYNKQDLAPTTLKKATVLISIDPTGAKGKQSKNKDPDYTGVSILLIDTAPHETYHQHGRPEAPNRIFVVDAYQFRASTAHTAQHTLELYRKWRPDVICIEAQGAQSLHEWVYELDASIPIETVSATLSKRSRLESITPWLQDHRQRVLFHPQVIELEPQTFTASIGGPNPTVIECRRTLRHQMLNFPTTHDDVLDSTVQGLRFTRQWILPYENEDEDNPPRNTAEVDMKVRVISA